MLKMSNPRKELQYLFYPMGKGGLIFHDAGYAEQIHFFEKMGAPCYSTATLRGNHTLTEPGHEVDPATAQTYHANLKADISVTRQEEMHVKPAHRVASENFYIINLSII
eukprot:15365424-Ditylum_brightwellii.AAC.2